MLKKSSYKNNYKEKYKKSFIARKVRQKTAKQVIDEFTKIIQTFQLMGKIWYKI